MSHYLRDNYETEAERDERIRALRDECRDPWGYDETTYPEYMAGMGENDGVPE